MAGLLGDSWDDPRTQATLQLAAGLLGGGNFGQALGRGLGGYQQSMSAAQEAKMRKEEMDWKRQEIAAKQAQAQEAQRIEGAVRQAAQGGGLNANALIAQGVPVERVKALFEAQNLGKQKVARTIKGMGPDGREMEFQVDEFGNRVGEGMAQYKAPIQSDLGGRQVFLDPYKLSEIAGMNKSMTPEGRDASARGWASNAIAQGNLGISRERLAFEQSGGADAMKPQYKDGQWVTPPTGMQPGESRLAAPSTAAKDANEALALIGTARQLIPKSTGSYMGAGVDQIGRVFGASTGGDTAAAQLKALEGALVAKMPKMSGPQSDKDVMLYKQMAGEIGDPTIPASRKMAALQTIEEIQRRASGGGAPAVGGTSGSWGIQKVQ
jgi:hypothetical protein